MRLQPQISGRGRGGGARLRTESPAEVQAAESGYLAALAGLDIAQAALRDAERPPAAAIAAGQAAVAQARAEFQSAQASQSAISEGSAPQSPCFRTQDGLSFDRDESPSDAVACDAAQAAAEHAVVAASAAVVAAEQQLDQVRAGGSPASRAQLSAAVKQAQADVATAKAQLDAFHSGGAASRRDSLLDQVVAARANLAAAQARLDAAIHSASSRFSRRMTSSPPRPKRSCRRRYSP